MKLKTRSKITTNNLPIVPLHRLSWKAIEKGHPWIIKDQFTDKFPRHPWLFAKDKKNQVILLNDPQHKSIKARIWNLKAKTEQMSEDIFLTQLEKRVETAMLKRSQILHERENLYLIFGEADQVPGVHLQIFGGVLFLQFYAFFWHDYQKELIKIIKTSVIKCFPQIKWQGIHIQTRNNKQNKNLSSLSWKETLPDELIIKEFDIKYLLNFKSFYDIGIYSDMAAIRKEIKPYLSEASSLLNLYSYTGAYSLFALNENISEVVSVDLSEKYIHWLQKNLELNPNLKKENHTSITSSVDDSINTFLKNKKEFDFIVSDPPSFSSDGKTTSQALKNYKKLLPKLEQITSKDGLILLFLNTHKITRNKFQKDIEEIISNNRLSLKIIKRVGLKEDCPALKGHPEGSYLKGFILKKKIKE